jgi:hypothetical protein
MIFIPCQVTVSPCRFSLPSTKRWLFAGDDWLHLSFSENENLRHLSLLAREYDHKQGMLFSANSFKLYGRLQTLKILVGYGYAEIASDLKSKMNKLINALADDCVLTAHMFIVLDIDDDLNANLSLPNVNVTRILIALSFWLNISIDNSKSFKLHFLYYTISEKYAEYTNEADFFHS